MTTRHWRGLLAVLLGGFALVVARPGIAQLAIGGAGTTMAEPTTAELETLRSALGADSVSWVRRGLVMVDGREVTVAELIEDATALASGTDSLDRQMRRFEAARRRLEVMDKDILDKRRACNDMPYNSAQQRACRQEAEAMRAEYRRIEENALPVSPVPEQQSIAQATRQIEVLLDFGARFGMDPEVP